MTWEDDGKIQSHREDMRKKTREEAESIMKLAGFEIRHVWELANGYWPDGPTYDAVRKPWWLFFTEIGPVEIGWRKNVLQICWPACAVRGLVTQDDVSKEETWVHAWRPEKAIEYLRELRQLAQVTRKGLK
jgi:hypothetical protein